MQKIYLDNNATTQLDPQVLQVMLRELTGPPANPSSVHSFGKNARSLLTSARTTLAKFFHAKPEEIVFTSGGTESLNLLLRGLGPGHIISTAIEHSAIFETLPSSTTHLPVGLWGAPHPEDLERAIRPDTRAIILSLANTETGVKIDIDAIANIAAKHNIPLLLDAVSYAGKEPLPNHPAITAIAISGHKFHAPKGVGALFIRSSFPTKSLLTGGHQENNHRAGTENLAGIIGLAEALEILMRDQEKITQHLTSLRNHFEKTLLAAFPDFKINGEGPRISNTSNIAFTGLDGETLLIQLDLAGIAASHGSACSSGALEPSRVLTNMGLDRKTARSSIRFSFSRLNTLDEINLALERIITIVKKLRKIVS